MVAFSKYLQPTLKSIVANIWSSNAQLLISHLTIRYNGILSTFRPISTLNSFHDKITRSFNFPHFSMTLKKDAVKK